MLDVLLESYTEFLGRKPDRPPQIAIVDLKDMPTQKEFELFKEFFDGQGYPSVICSPDQLAVRKQPSAHGRLSDRYRLQAFAGK